MIDYSHPSQNIRQYPPFLDGYRLLALLVFLGFYLPVHAQIQPHKSQADEEESAIRQLLYRFVDTLVKKDINETLAFWSTASPHVDSFKQSEVLWFATTTRRFRVPLLSHVEIQANRATLRARFDCIAHSLKTGQTEQQSFEDNVTLVKENGKWMIWQLDDASRDFATKLLAATEVERTRLLKTESASITLGLIDALLDTGNSLMAQKDAQRARSSFEMALKLSRQIPSQKGIRSALWGIGLALDEEGEFEQALSDYRLALTISRQLHDGSSEALLASNIAATLIHQGDYVSAFRYYQQSEAIYERMGDTPNSANIIKQIGDAHFNLKKYPDALSAYSRVLRLSPKPDLQRDTLEGMAKVYEAQSDYKTALTYWRRFLNPAPEDEKSLGELSDRFFAVNEPWDLKKWEILWSEDAPFQFLLEMPASDDRGWETPTPGTREKNQLTSYSIRRRVILVRDTWATVRLGLQRKTDGGSSDQLDGLTPTTEQNLDFIKEDGGWKVWRYYPRTKELANAIAEAETDEERRALLEEEPSIVNDELTHQLVFAGDRLVGQRKYSKGRVVYQVAQDLAAKFGDLKGVASKVDRIASAYLAQGEPERALESYRQSLAMRKGLADQKGMAESEASIALLHLKQGNYESARDYLQQTIDELGSLTDDESRHAVGIAYLLLGQTYLNQGDLSRAEQYFQKVLHLAEERNDEQGTADALEFLGELFTLRGEYKQAMTYFQRAQEVSGDSDDGARNFLVGTTYLVQGNYSLASRFMQKRLGPVDPSASEPDAFAVAYNHFLEQNYVAALPEFQQLLPEEERLGNRAETAAALQLIGLIHLVQDNYPAAINSLKSSASACAQMKNRPLTAEVLRFLAWAYEEAGENEKALDAFDRSLKLYQQMGNKRLNCIVSVELADFLQNNGDYEKAFVLLQTADRDSREIGSPELMWQVQALIGRSFLASRQLEKAEQSFRFAIRTIETLRDNVSGGNQQKEHFFENKLLPFEGMIELLIDQNKWFAALRFAEESKARVLLDVLRGYKLDPTKPLPSAVRDQEAELINHMTRLNRQILSAELSVSCNDENLSSLKSERRKARLDFDDFQARLAITHPELNSMPRNARPFTEQDISTLLPDSRTVLLEYVVTREKTLVFVIDRDSASALRINVFPIAIKSKELDARIQDFLKRIAPVNPNQRSNDFKESASDLYNLLLMPAANQLVGKSSLIIIPDGELWNLPFQALQTPGKRFVIEEFAVSYAPSLSTLREMIATRELHSQKPAAKSKPLLLALGDPTLPVSGKQPTNGAACRVMSELPAAANEVTALKSDVYSGLASVYIGPTATEERLKKEAGNYKIIAVAAHGLLDDDEPLYSQIFLATEASVSSTLISPNPTFASTAAEPDAAEDGVLEAWEISRLRLSADLVVLSACETARGHIGDGEGVIGLTWALSLAGVPTTVASQWIVNSQSTADLMIEFHRQLAPRMFDKADSVGPAVALQRASLRILKDSSHRDRQHPYFWAGFVVIGDGR